eukprot:CAMPEP_0197507714 /NCGR_PEP_ID=MMETSP1312-20131121/18964_1 /TAXON_ID=464262 /ORGANISM="Genus nov. species nov., Strain RCC2335" /LENGTH=151 /DNA_ID=CAMNT_0043055345 /DNA_START=87 /DNA_END=539 /DNA_ORIENTATION=+
MSKPRELNLCLSLTSTFFSFSSTYQSLCRSSNDFKRSSFASHALPCALFMVSSLYSRNPSLYISRPKRSSRSGLPVVLVAGILGTSSASFAPGSARSLPPSSALNARLDDTGASRLTSDPAADSTETETIAAVPSPPAIRPRDSVRHLLSA